MSNLYNIVSKRLSSQFSQTSKFSLSSTLTILTGLSAMYYGPGGYAKTEMIQALMSIFDETTIRREMLECNPDTTVSNLLGGAIAKTISELEADDRTRIEITREDIDFTRGPLENEFFFLEEALDGPFNVLAALKALITNKRWNGRISQNQSFFGATNIDPYLLLNELPTVHRNSIEALLQRFLILEHRWESHEKKDYLEMLEVGFDGIYTDFHPLTLADIRLEQQLVKEVKLANSDNEALAQFCEDSAKEGYIVSPRTFMYSRRLLRAIAYCRGRDTINDDDFSILDFLPSYAPTIREDVTTRLELSRASSAQQKKLDGYIADLAHILTLRNSDKNKTFVNGTIAKRCRKLYEDIQSASFSESFFEQRDQLVKTIDSEIKASEKATFDSIQDIPLPERNL